MSDILITGCAGLVGANFSRYMVKQGYTVSGIDDFSGGYKDFVSQDIECYEMNLSDAERLSVIFDREKPATVYHFAAYAAEGLSPFIRSFNYTNNVVCSANVINQCVRHNVKKIVFTSSMAVYGHGLPPFDETMQPSPADPYGIAKYTIEQDLEQAYQQFGLPYTLARPHNIIGIYQNIWDRYRNVIGIWIRRIQRGESILIFGDGMQTRAFSDIQYYMEPFEKLGSEDHNQEVFNLGADQFITILEAAKIVQSVAKQYGYDTPIEHVEQRNEVKHAYCDHTKAKKVLGFKDMTDFETLVDDMFKWALTQPDRQVKFMPYEIEEGIYSAWK